MNIGPAPIHGGQIGLRGHERPVTGRVSDVAVDPTDGRHWLVGGAQGGVWETIDAGHTWVPLTDDQGSLATGVIAFAPANPLVVYVGTGEPIEQKGVAAGFGLLKLSRNASTPWVVTKIFEGFDGLSFSDVKVFGDGGDTDRLVVATRDVRPDFHETTPPIDRDRWGILEYAKGDGGQRTWTRYLTGNATDLEVHPAHFDRMYAGITFTRIDREHKDLPPPSLPGVYRRGVHVAGGISPPILCPADRKPKDRKVADARQCDFPEMRQDPNDLNNPWQRISGPWDVAACYAACDEQPKPEDEWQSDLWRFYLARTELAIGGSQHPEHPDVLYVSIARREVSHPDENEEYRNSRLLGLWRTGNAWAEKPDWVPVRFDETDGGGGEFGYCGAHPAAAQVPLCHWSHEIIVDPKNPNVLYAGGIGLWKGEIQCASGSAIECRPVPGKPLDVKWTEVSQTAPLNTPTPRLRRRGIHVDQQTMAWDKAGRRLIVGNDGGVWSTTDGGRNWADHNSGLSIVQFYRGGVADTPGGIVVMAGTQDNGIVRWDGSRWEWLLGGDGGVVAISNTDPRRAVVATESTLFGKRLRRTVDGGREFTFADAAPTGSEEAPVVPIEPLTMPLVMCPDNDDVLLAGATDLWVSPRFFSTQASPSWTSVSGSKNGSVTAVAFGRSRHTCKRFAFGTEAVNDIESEVHITTTGGTSWCRLIHLPLPSAKSKITALAFDEKHPRTLYATIVDQAGIDPQFGRVAMTTNAPETAAECAGGAEIDPGWTLIALPKIVPVSARPFQPNTCAPDAQYRGDAQPPSRPADWREHIHAVAVHPLTSDVYVGTNAGVWRRQYGRAEWVRHGCAVGMPNVPVFDIKIAPKSGQVVAFTYGRGAFLWHENSWCGGSSLAGAGTNFLPCPSQGPIRLRHESPPRDLLSSP